MNSPLAIRTAAARAEDAPMIMRGKALRQAIIIRMLAVERLFRAVVIGLAAYAVWKFRGARGSIQDTLDRDLRFSAPPDSRSTR